MEQIPFDNHPGIILHVNGKEAQVLEILMLTSVIGARGIRPAYFDRDSFVELILNDQLVGKTKVIKNEFNPQWNEDITVPLSGHPVQDILQAR